MNHLPHRTPKRLFAAGLLALLAGPALAQNQAQPSSSASSNGLGMRTTAPRYTSSPVRLTMTVSNSNSSAQPQELSAPRDNRQDCSFGPLVRVLEVGTRRVVYPPAEDSAQPMLCAQDMFMETVPAGGSLKLERSLNLPKGDYMIESWFGSAGGSLRLSSEPVRVTVW